MRPIYIYHLLDIIRQLKWQELTIEAKEGIGRGSNLLFYCEVVIKGHLLHPRHETLIWIHCRTNSPVKSPEWLKWYLGRRKKIKVGE